MDSILQGDTRECYLTGATDGLHRHHIYFGTPNRKISEDWHNGAEYGVHFNRDLDLKLKRECQEKYEETHSREEFRKLIGKSYL